MFTASAEPVEPVILELESLSWNHHKNDSPFTSRKLCGKADSLFPRICRKWLMLSWKRLKQAKKR